MRAWCSVKIARSMLPRCPASVFSTSRVRPHRPSAVRAAAGIGSTTVALVRASCRMGPAPSVPAAEQLGDHHDRASRRAACR